MYITEPVEDWSVNARNADEVTTFSSTRQQHNGSGSINNPAYDLSIQVMNVEKIVFNDKTFDLAPEPTPAPVPDPLQLLYQMSLFYLYQSPMNESGERGRMMS
ncbi:hypothetical protein SynRS9915_00424 [Synechococcus sp. RS9915]|nr:hypothetical protein SynRS9915_00424 [Synechococcus sp. RS9915]